ncbi:MAG: gliding motility-associated C-terminal domain-containing protein [Cyclobacteriaceae bacterium]|nr:gliding motility-associated C-terminal domain-containing protein [Cyclobacteriaceae bacterium]
MRHAIIFSLLFGSVALHAQQFKQLTKIKLSEKLEVSQAAWVSLNSDTLLDVVVTGKNQAGDVKIITLENEAGVNLFERLSLNAGISEGRFLLTDVNNDNQIDLLAATGNKVKSFLSRGDFTFTTSEINLPTQILNAITGDLNRDGVLELITFEIVLNEPHIRIYERVAGQFKLRSDTTGISVTDFKLFDLNQDNFTDIIVSGTNSDGQPVLQQWKNKGRFQFTKTSLESPVNGKLSLLDFNADGFFDLWAIGFNESGNSIYVKWLNQAGELKFDTEAGSIIPVQLFSGNSDADGLTDQWIFGNLNNKKINHILTATDTIKLDTAGVVFIQPGDFDRDGNLDFLQVLDSADGTWLKVFRNTLEAKDTRPTGSSFSFAISTFNRTFIYWAPARDASTATASLTYDVWLGTNSETLISPSFSRNHGRRTIVEHGNVYTNNHKIIEGLTDNRYYYLVQTVDNAFNGSYDVCTGGVLPCFDLTRETVQACKGNEVELKSEGVAYWFSLSRGFLGVSDTYSYVPIESDTVFSFIPQGTDCSKHKAWLINVNDGNQSENKTIYACAGSTIKLGIAPGWNSIRWSTNPIIADQDSISVLITQPQLIQVQASAGGCQLNNSFDIKLSKPELSMNTTQFNIQRGESVQFNVSTNAELIQWTPPTGLSDVTIPNPMASPAQSTQYFIEVMDSIGCKNTGSIFVEVQQTGFIPDLFTPNSDGNNDVLIVYGLTQASSFRFRIFNREGAVVYQTDNLSEAIASGWNGSTNGNAQPTGMYFWRVEGILPNGELVLLNGNKSGSVFLMR